MGRGSIRLFEIGRSFRMGADGPVEEERVAALLTGPASEEWPAERSEQAFLDAKGTIEHLLAGLGVSWSVGEPAAMPWHPGRSFQVVLAGEPAGTVGEFHPSVGGSFDLPDRVAAFELPVEPLLASASDLVEFRHVSRFPPLRRDVAFLVDEAVPAGAVRTALVPAAGDLLERVILFDLFEGDPLPEGKKSLAFALDLRAPDRTLTDQDADETVRAIAERLRADFGAELRAG
jgi:phenylalanyl-tRNA synthetase beta chain